MKISTTKNLVFKNVSELFLATPWTLWNTLHRSWPSFL